MKELWRFQTSKEPPRIAVGLGPTASSSSLKIATYDWHPSNFSSTVLSPLILQTLVLLPFVLLTPPRVFSAHGFSHQSDDTLFHRLCISTTNLSQTLYILYYGLLLCHLLTFLLSLDTLMCCNHQYFCHLFYCSLSLNPVLLSPYHILSIHIIFWFHLLRDLWI